MTGLRITGVLLDAGNTLVFMDRKRVRDLLGDVGVVATPDRIEQAEAAARLVLYRQVADGGTGTEPEVWREYFRVLFRESGVPEDLVHRAGERIVELHAQAHLWTGVEEGTGEALELLRARGFRLAVISNADGRIEEALVRAGIRHHFEFVMDSHVVRMEKPHPGIFLAACERLGLTPPECLYVGDLFPVDVVGARSAGLHAVLLDPMGRLDHPVDRIRSVTELPAYLAGVLADEPAPR